MAVKRAPTFGESITSLLILAFFIVVGCLIMKLRIEMMMIFATIGVAFLAMRLGMTWNEIEDAISNKIKMAIPVLLLMISVGLVIAAFMYSGSIPMLLYYGIKWISPEYLYVSAMIGCMITSLATGTSWGSIGTMGVTMMGIAAGLGLPLDITAGACLCGAVFGDKLSPMSETTNLAPLCAGSTLYEHIYSLLYTTLPGTIVAFVVFYMVGSNISAGGAAIPENAVATMATLGKIYSWNVILLLPFLIILFCALKKYPAVPTMLAASLTAVALGFAYQGFDLAKGIQACVFGFKVNMIYADQVTKDIMTLLNRGGMTSMINVILIVFFGYSYAGIVTKTGMLETALRPIANGIKSTFSLIISTLVTMFFLFGAVGSAYAPFLITGDMYRKIYAEKGIRLNVLSRCLEDIGTIIGQFMPWSATGMFYASTLGLSIFGDGGYAPWVILGYASPIMAVICAATGFGIFKMSKEEQEKEMKKLEELEAK